MKVLLMFLVKLLLLYSIGLYFLYDMLQTIHKNALNGEWSVLVWIFWSLSVLLFLTGAWISYYWRMRKAFLILGKYRFYGLAAGIIGFLVSSFWPSDLNCYSIQSNVFAASICFISIAIVLFFFTINENHKFVYENTDHQIPVDKTEKFSIEKQEK